MIKLNEMYFLGRDVRTLQRRAEYLTKTLTAAEREGKPRAGQLWGELAALRRLLSQLREKGVECEPPAKITPGVETYRGWRISYLGGSHATPWMATSVGGCKLARVTQAELKEAIDNEMVVESLTRDAAGMRPPVTL